MSLPRGLPLPLMTTQWATALDPVIANPLLSGNFLTGVSLKNGVTVIPHKLSRNQQGWMITDINGAAQIYRSQPLNSTTLTLTSNAAVVVDILVY